MTLDRRHFLAWSAAAAGALLTACGEVASPAPAGGGNPATGGTLRLGSVAAGGGTASTDPHGSLFSESDWVRLTCLYDVLSLAEGDTVQPRLATGWQPNATADRWTFNLRPDARFSDGRAVTADDVLYSLRRMDEQKMSNGMRLGTVDAAASRVVDPHTLEIATSSPDAELPRTLAGVVFVVPQGTTDFTRPIGSGPFTLETLDQNAAVLRRNPTWWGPKTGADTVEIRGFSDPQALSAAITSGAIDVASGVAPATARAGQAQLNLVRRPGAECYPLLMRVDAAPFDIPEVRTAVKLGVDREALVQQVLLGYGTVGKDMIKLNDPSVPADAPAVTRDVPRAKELLQGAGRAGTALVLHTTAAYPGMLAAATLIAKQLEDIGLKVEVKQHAPDTYWTQAYTVEPFTMGYYSDTTFATTIRQTALTTSGFSETGWKKPEFDAAFTKALATTDEASRRQQLGALHRQMATEGGWCVWGFADGLDLAKRSVTGLHPGAGRYALDGVSV